VGAFIFFRADMFVKVVDDSETTIPGGIGGTAEFVGKLGGVFTGLNDRGSLGEDYRVEPCQKFLLVCRCVEALAKGLGDTVPDG
jgi:hypothetical protein